MATETKKKYEGSEGQAAAQAESIAAMMAALECDYDRLEEVRDELTGAWEEAVGESDESRTFDEWLKAQPEEDMHAEAEEYAELLEASTGLDVNYPCKSREDAEERIQQDPLSVRIFGERINGEWEADRFEILLCTGGPACRIMGELDGNQEPSRAWLEHQDWGTPWTQFYDVEQDTLLAYARCFFYGE